MSRQKRFWLKSRDCRGTSWENFECRQFSCHTTSLAWWVVLFGQGGVCCKFIQPGNLQQICARHEYLGNNFDKFEIGEVRRGKKINVRFRKELQASWQNFDDTLFQKGLASLRSATMTSEEKSQTRSFSSSSPERWGGGEVHPVWTSRRLSNWPERKHF